METREYSEREARSGRMRYVYAALLLAAFVFLLAGCGGKSSDEASGGGGGGGDEATAAETTYDGPNVSIQFWNGFTGGDGP